MGQEKRVYETLNGMRGLAALAVVSLHLEGVFSGTPHFAGANLAVDLFFILSGFVLAEAYGSSFDRGMGALDFMRKRLIRLYPLYILGTVISLAIWLPGLRHGDFKVLGAGAFAMAMLPDPFDKLLYPLNIPAWSLFFELLVNLFLAILWPRLSRTVLLVLIMAGLAGLIAGAPLYGSLVGGPKWDGFAVGCARTCFSFFAGVAISRWRLRGPAIHPWLILAAMAGLFAVSPPAAWNWLSDLLIVVVALPILVLLGASCEPGRFSRPVFSLLGVTSYAVYALHVPLLSLTAHAAKALHLPLNTYVAAAFAGGLILAAWLADRYFDGPVRGLISRTRAGSGPASAGLALHPLFPAAKGADEA